MKESDYLRFSFFYREFFGQGWMKNDKNERTPYIMKTTKHFNDVRACSGIVNKMSVLQIDSHYYHRAFFFLSVRSATGSPQRSCSGTMSTCEWRWSRNGWRWPTSAAASTTTTPCWRSRPLSTGAPSSASRRPGSKSPSRYQTFLIFSSCVQDFQPHKSQKFSFP